MVVTAVTAASVVIAASRAQLASNRHRQIRRRS